MQKLHNTRDNFAMELDGAMDDSQTTMVVASVTGAPTVPFYAYIDSECLECTALATKTYTVVRGCGDTSASAHDDEAAVNLYNTSLYIQELQAGIEKLGRFVSAQQGGGDGVIRNQGSEMEVVAQATPDMTVQVGTGMGFVSDRPVELTAAEDTAAITAPTGNPRIDLVQIDQYDTVSIKTGSEAASPSAPSPDSGAMGLAEIYCPVGMTHIDDADGGDGYITDARTFV